MKNNSVRFRAWNVGANVEFQLPNGKTVLVDPFFSTETFPDGHTREDVKAADYIIITHTHFDHEMDLGYFVKKFNSKVFVGVYSQMAEMKYHKIPFDNIIPVFPNSTYEMEDFKITFYQAKHNSNGGKIWDGQPIAGQVDHVDCDTNGSMDSLDFILETENNFKIGMASGVVLWRNFFETCKKEGVNLLFRQSGLRESGGGMFSGKQVNAETLAKLMVSYGAQTIVPFHMDVMVKRQGEEWVENYFADVAKEVNRLQPGAQFIYPKACRWYSVGMFVEEDE